MGPSLCDGTGMGRLLLLLFILVPAIELILLIELGRLIGTLETLALIAITGVLGASLARYQGLEVLRQLRSEVAVGHLPAGPIVDGILILLAGALLITPGVLTDAFGFLCLIPLTRKIVKDFLRRRLERAVREGRVRVSMQFGEPKTQSPEDRVYDVRPKSDGVDSNAEPSS